MTFEQAVSHSLPQLKEMRAAAARVNAARLLSLLPTVFAAVAAAMHKDNSKIYDAHEKALKNKTEP